MRNAAALLVATSVLMSCSAASSSTSSKDRAYIGKPGAVPHVTHMPANEYGAYTFASEMNFCRGTRWIISGTMASLWPDEPQPVLVKRGTRIHILGREHLDCGSLDDRLSMVSGDLVHYQTEDGNDRYVSANDVYTQGQYDAYRAHQTALAKATKAQARATHVHALPLVTLEPIVAQYGYEEALNKTINENVDATVTHNEPCSVSNAQYFNAVARSAFVVKDYTKARLYAWSGWEYAGSCHNDVGSKESGDSLLIFSKSEIRLGLRTAGKNDADAAASSYLSCQDAENVYGEDDRDYCEAHRLEAEDIVKNG